MASTRRLIKMPGVMNMVARSKSQIYAEIADGQFPIPVKLGKRSVAWVESEIQEWIEKRIAASRNHGDLILGGQDEKRERHSGKPSFQARKAADT